MRPPAKRAYVLRGDEIERRRSARGWNLETLCSKADVHLRTLRRILAGKPAYLTTAASLARALDVDCKTLLDGYAPAPKTATMLTMRVSAIGNVECADEMGELAKVMEDLAGRLAAAGIRVSTADAQISGPTGDDDAVRIIVRIDAFMLPNPGASIHGFKPTWLYAAIRPSMFRAMLDAHEKSTLTLYRNFERYGAFLIYGSGYAPPKQVARAIERLTVRRPHEPTEYD